MIGEQVGHLLQHLLDAALLLLVGVKDLQEGLVRPGVVGKALLDGSDVGDGVIELDGMRRRLLLRLRRGWPAHGARLRLHGPTARWLLLTSLGRTARRGLVRRAPSPGRGGAGPATAHPTSSTGGSTTARASTAHVLLLLRRRRRGGWLLSRLQGWSGQTTGLQILELDLVPLGQEGVESQDEVVVATEQRRHSPDDAGRVDLLCLEVLHDLEELVVDAGAVAELQLDLIEVEEGVLHLELAHLGWGGMSASSASPLSLGRLGQASSRSWMLGRGRGGLLLLQLLLLGGYRGGGRSGRHDGRAGRLRGLRVGGRWDGPAPRHHGSGVGGRPGSRRLLDRQGRHGRGRCRSRSRYYRRGCGCRRGCRRGCGLLGLCRGFLGSNTRCRLWLLLGLLLGRLGGGRRLALLLLIVVLLGWSLLVGSSWGGSLGSSTFGSWSLDSLGSLGHDHILLS
mmetsp:Transcript_17792/g.50922  ORF Transcript_17792/g.50922 Transcript_17792/m.50922 type:complete len:452 (-) Transcript_17792:126-1481(-)